MLAATENGQIFIYLAFALYGVYAWWQDKKKKQEAEELEKRIRNNQVTPAQPDGAPSQPVNRPASQPTPAQGEISEQERLRRFLAALGVPAAPSPQGQRPAPPPQPRPQPRPVAPVVVRPSFQPAPPPPIIVRPPVAPVKAVAPPPPQPQREFSRPVTEVQGEVEHYEKRAVEKVTPERKETGTEPAVRHGSFLPGELRDTLRSRQSIRAAIIAREILGPPVGL